jgi:hypothetical protein
MPPSKLEMRETIPHFTFSNGRSSISRAAPTELRGFSEDFGDETRRRRLGRRLFALVAQHEAGTAFHDLPLLSVGLIAMGACVTGR